MQLYSRSIKDSCLRVLDLISIWNLGMFFFKGSTRRKISRRKAEETRITYRVHSGTSNRATRYNGRWIVVCQSLTFIFEGQWTCINCLTASDFVIMSLVCHMTVSWAQVCPAVLVKIKVCGGCSVSRAHKTFFRSILFCICQLIEITWFFLSSSLIGYGIQVIPGLENVTLEKFPQELRSWTYHAW